MRPSSLLFLLLLCYPAAILSLESCRSFCGYDKDFNSIRYDDPTAVAVCVLNPITGYSPYTLDGRVCVCSDGYGGWNCSQRVTYEKYHINDCLGFENETDLLKKADNCLCTSGWGGDLCDVPCPSAFKSCTPGQGFCTYNRLTKSYGCSCYNGLGPNCATARSDIVTAISVFSYILIFTFFGVAVVGWILYLASAIGEGKQKCPKGPSLANVGAFLFAVGATAKVISLIMDVALFNGASISIHFMMIFYVISLLLLIICNSMMIFRWAVICEMISNMKTNSNLSVPQKIILIILIITIVFTAIVGYIADALQETVPVLLFLFGAYNLLLPLLFTIYGLRMFFVLKAVNERLNLLSLKFTRFLVAIELVCLLNAVVLVLRVVFEFLKFAPDSKYNIELFLQIVVGQESLKTITYYIEFLLYLLFMWLVGDEDQLLNNICCCFKPLVVKIKSVLPGKKRETEETTSN